MPVLLTFDVDGELLWLCRDSKNTNRPVTLSLGQYGIHCGLPRILKLLKKYEVKGTFFVPGYIAENYPESILKIHEAHHDIGNHSYRHTYPDMFPSKEAEEQDYVKTQNILTKLLGKKPVGYRSPAWEFSKNSLDILEGIGIEYSSNMMGSDRIEYLKLYDRKSEIAEIPVHWVLDDAAYWLYSVRVAGKSMQPLQAVENYWKDEFDGIYEEFMEEEKSGIDSDLCYVLTCHPQIIGRPARMKVLENVLKHIKNHPHTEFLTAKQAAQKFKNKR